MNGMYIIKYIKNRIQIKYPVWEPGNEIHQTTL